jgi:hypothetical protein
MPEDEEFTVSYEVYMVVLAANPEQAKQKVESALYAALGAAEEAGVEGAHDLQYRYLHTI